MDTSILHPKEPISAQTAQAEPAAVKTPSGPMWQSDDVAKRIHNAFILGWSLVELRSRIQVADLDESKLPSMATDGKTKEEGSSEWSEDKPKAAAIPADPVQLVTDKNDRLLRASRMRTAFNAIVTLQRSQFKTSITIDTLYDPPGEEELPYLYEPAPDYANIGKTPDSAGATTVETAGSPDPNAGTTPATPNARIGRPRGPRYANIGIQPLLDENGKQVWTDFRLFEVTRRAINCLTLLLVTPGESLVPNQVKTWQEELTRQVLGAAEKDSQKAGSNGSMAQSLTTTAVESCKRYGEKDAADPSSPDSPTLSAPLLPRSEQGIAIHTLCVLIVRLLQAWDGYLRERIAAEGVDANNLVTLVAYEAGRNLATLSWFTSVNAIVIENRAKEKDSDWWTLKEEMHKGWHKTFTDSNVVQVLHQITALSSILDDSYDRSAGKPAAPPAGNSQDDLLARPDPGRPSQVLQAVRESIEYWQRTVLWLGTPAEKDGQPVELQDKNEKPFLAANRDLLTQEDWQDLRNALIEQSGIWFNLMTGQQDLRGFTIENITHQILDESLDQFREYAQKDLPAAAEQAVREVGEVIDVARKSVGEIGRKAKEAVSEGLKDVFSGVSPILWLAVIISAVIAVGLLVYMVVAEKQDTIMGVISSGITAVLSWLGIQRGKLAGAESANKINGQIDTETEKQAEDMKQKTDAVQKKKEAGGSLAGLAGGVLGQAGDFLLSAYDKGLRRIQIELQSLNYSVAVAHPLIAFFIRHNRIDVSEDFDFLTKVIWDNANRKEQLQRIVTAAFGPLSILLTRSGKKETSPDAVPLSGQPAS